MGGLNLINSIVSWLLFAIPGAVPINDFGQTAMISWGVTWTLRYEWFFFLSLPIFALFFTNSKNRVACLFSIISLVLLFSLANWAPYDKYRLLPFGGGILTSYLTRNKYLRKICQKNRSSLQSYILVSAQFTPF